MNSNTLIPLVIILVVVIAAVAVLYATRRNRSEKLRKRFGSEYDYTVEKEGSARKAEMALEEREKRVQKFQIRPLEEDARNRYNDEWLQIQRNFVDDPRSAVDHANRLITEVMIARGFPVADFEQRAADLSVLYPQFVPNYRNAYEIAMRNQNDGTSTEDLRQAMVYYHSLFDELLETERTREMEATK